ncbi:MAG: hypothetical protein HRF45_02305 [Fimbriimonadia bacterium]|jgi:hypothetical protein
MAVDGGAPLSRVTPTSGSNAVRPADRREGRQDRAHSEEEEPRDVVEIAEGEDDTPQPEAEPESEEMVEGAKPKLDIRA